MTETPKPESSSRWWIALNVTRTRVTLLGFNLSFVAFLVSLFLAVYEEQAFTDHLPAMSALFLAFTFSLLAAGALLTSQELDEAGRSRPWLFSLGDIMMYLALSQSVAGFSRKYLGATIEGVDRIHETHPGFEGTGSFLQAMMVALALLAWCLLTYVGPWIAIRRSPLARGPRRFLVAFYLAALLSIFAVATQAHMLQDVVLGEPEPTLVIVLKQFIQPLTW